ncbi:aldehyde dehydrogenase family protein, partial [Ensifer adhaerens]|uniref:aldehyde dehydrogenase family protein n=1 Tax=Ensifer adhaerens TaxID=106592 RepID=UPI000DC2F6D1
MGHYPDILLHIDGAWRPARSGKTIPFIDPANEETIGQVAWAEVEDLNEALAAAEKGFKTWRATSAFDRAQVMR